MYFKHFVTAATIVEELYKQSCTVLYCIDHFHPAFHTASQTLGHRPFHVNNAERCRHFLLAFWSLSQLPKFLTCWQLLQPRFIPLFQTFLDNDIGLAGEKNNHECCCHVSLQCQAEKQWSSLFQNWYFETLFHVHFWRRKCPLGLCIWGAHKVLKTSKISHTTR